MMPSPRHIPNSYKEPHQTLQELLGLIESAGRPLQIVLVTDDERFDDIPFRAWWSRGHWSFQRQSDPFGHELVVDIPDEIFRRIQARFVGKAARRWLGVPSLRLPQPIRRSLDRERQWARFDKDQRLDVVADLPVFVDGLRQSIESSSDPERLWLEVVVDDFLWPVTAQVVESRLEISIARCVPLIIDAWRTDFKRHVLGLED